MSRLGRRRPARVWWAVAATIGTAGLILGIVTLNQRWPNPDTRTALAGQSLVIDGVALTVEHSLWVTGTDLSDLLPNYTFDMTDNEGRPLPMSEMAMVVIDLTLQPRSEAPAGLDLSTWYLESGAWNNGLDLDAFHQLNPGAPTIAQVGAGEQLRLRLPYCLYSFQFKPGDWAQATDRRFGLIRLDYPGKDVLELLLDRVM